MEVAILISVVAVVFFWVRAAFTAKHGVRADWSK
jgi:hypothetical protein